MSTKKASDIRQHSRQNKAPALSFLLGWLPKKENTTRGQSTLLRGSIRKRGQNTYQVRIFLGKDESGRQLTHTKTIHGTKKDAEKYAREAVYRIDAGQFAVQSDPTLEEFWNSQKPLIKQRLQLSTFEYKETIWRIYLAPMFAGKKLQTITPALCSSFVSKLIEKGLGAHSIRRIIQDLKSLLNLASRLNLIKK